MISVTRLNGSPFIMNAELIKTIESTPDTMITLISGEHVVVKEAMDEVVRRAVTYCRSIRAFAS
ncbi:MAG: flagellar FlbD family protein [Planctomycetota bacterium]|nr:flagellar FlbD family protein [Planctomycetota bacterium]MCZ6697340.1 flagellar FlbD family protein [Planctomycetota bacterium]MCZ6816393.1 flagellar FlbD family protein [Planctomycetota bacterium]